MLNIFLVEKRKKFVSILDHFWSYWFEFLGYVRLGTLYLFKFLLRRKSDVKYTINML